MSDIVERLRASRSTWENARGRPSDLEREAADELERLQAQNERLREAIARAKDLKCPDPAGLAHNHISYRNGYARAKADMAAALEDKA